MVDQETVEYFSKAAADGVDLMDALEARSIQILKETCEAAVAAERERCAKIVDAEAAEYQRQLDEHNSKITKGGFAPEEHGWVLHGKCSASSNAAALIRKLTANQ